MKKFIIGFMALAVGIAIFSMSYPLHAKKLKVGSAAPEFTLTDIDGKKHSLSDYQGKYVVLEWVNHGCPYVKKHYDTGNMQALQNEIVDKETVWLSICSSAKGRQGNLSIDEWKEVNKEKKVQSSIVLLDPKGKIGKKYGAKTTPHMYVINPEGKLIYNGAIDDRPSADKADIVGAKNYVQAALKESKEGKEVSNPSTRPYGCSVKYK